MTPPTPFDAIAGTYDELWFLRLAAERLVAWAEPRPGGRVLDVGTGTGTAAMAAARAVGTGGVVTGVDSSPAMLACARQRAAAAPGAPIQLLEGIAQRLPVPDGAFDLVLCASSLFVMPDMAASVRELARAAAPGGTVAISGFGPGFLQPLRTLLRARLQAHGLATAFPATGRLDTTAACAALLAKAGLVQVETAEEQLGRALASPEERWRDVVAGVEGLPLRRLGGEELQALRAEHLAELRSLAAQGALWADVPVLLARGRKSG